MTRDQLLVLLDLARWAPSGDNTQPWRFEITADDQAIVHGFDTRDDVIYDFDGHASHLAHGALIETMAIAASGCGHSLSWTAESDTSDRHPRYRITFFPSPRLQPSPLLSCIERRVVQRRPMSGALTTEQREAIRAAVGEDFSLTFFETFAERLQVAKLLWHNAHIRLTCPEAFPVHQSIIEWGVRFSGDRLPERAVGVDPMTGLLMRWIMKDWRRVNFFNRYLFGTIPPRIQLDFLPAIRCAAHILLKPHRPPVALDDWIAAGRTMQRLWLTTTQLGLHLQPEMTPVIFRWYAQANRPVSATPKINSSAVALARRFESLSDSDADSPFSFFCRVGECRPPTSRSLRLPLDRLLAKYDS